MFKRKSINLAALLALGAAALPAVAQNTQLDRVEITADHGIDMPTVSCVGATPRPRCRSA